MIYIMRQNSEHFTNYTFFSIENVYTQNYLNKFTVYTHLAEMKGNTKKDMNGVTETEA